MNGLYNSYSRIPRPSPPPQKKRKKRKKKITINTTSCMAINICENSKAMLLILNINCEISYHGSLNKVPGILNLTSFSSYLFRPLNNI
jgi:hypothetical protein